MDKVLLGGLGGKSKSLSCCWLVHHPHENVLITTDDKSQLIAIYHNEHADDVEEKKEISSCKQKEPTCAAFSLDGYHLFVGSKDNDVRSYKYPSFEFEGVITRSDHVITSVSVNKNNLISISSMSESSSVQIVDVSAVERPKTVLKIPVTGGVLCSKINSDSNIVAFITSDRDLKIINVDNEQELFHSKQQISKEITTFWNNQQGTTDFCPIVIAWSLCGDVLFSPNATIIEKDSKLWKRNAITKGEISNDIYITSFSPNSVHVALIDLDKNINLFEYQAFSSKKPKPYQTISLKSVVTSIDWSNNCNKFFVATKDGSIHMISHFINEKKHKSTYKVVDNEQYIKKLQDIDTDDVLSLIGGDDSTEQKKVKKLAEEIIDDDEIDELMKDQEEHLVEEEEIEPLEVVHSQEQPTGLKEHDFGVDASSFNTAPITKKHAAIQPTSSPFEKVEKEYKRYLAITQHVGLITASTNMTPESAPYYNIHIKFNLAGYSEEKFNDQHKPHVAALNENGIVFGSNANDLIHNTVIQFRKLRVTHQDKGWKVNLPSDEKIVLVALGSSFVAAGIEKETKTGQTRCSLVRVYSREQMNLGNIAVGGNLVSLCASENNLVIIYQQGTGLYMDWYDISVFSCLKSHRALPCNELLWAGFGTDTKDLLYVFDSTQVLYLLNPDTDSFSAWCDLKKNNDNSTHFISIISDASIYSILCGNHRSTPSAGHDMTSFKLNATNIEDVFIGSTIELEKGHDKPIRLSYARYVTRNVHFNHAFRKGTATKEDIVEVDRLVIALITRCIELKEFTAALNFAKLLRMKSSLNIVANFADSQKDSKLASTLRSLEISAKDVRNPKWPFPSFEGVASSTPSIASSSHEIFMTREQVTELIKQMLSSHNGGIINGHAESRSSHPTEKPDLETLKLFSSSQETSSVASLSPVSAKSDNKFEGEAEFVFESQASNKTIPQMFSPKRPRKKSVDASVKKKLSNSSNSQPKSPGVNPFQSFNTKNATNNHDKPSTSTPSTTSSGDLLSRISELGGAIESQEDAKKRKREAEKKKEEQAEEQPNSKKKKQPATQQPSVLEFVKKNVAIPKISSSELSSATKQALLQKVSQDEEEDDLDVSGILN
ncbi:hypothetical protein C9374_002244 [Naegleria lovaniensis]|uniref:WDHD1/CFT4 second beta-propeller domain-containing protein n=1 Tax=Naegleria lovaniensis TaxID=51637 RepID=A0AA88KK81_NAELO|nr:uncharacterized protein C9374_002244 [Naegleria lovaniensis]KAG2386500.1 hypothetical protein C9374_002244 [Naegleria lovaniensis]